MSRFAMIPKVKEGTIAGHRAIGIGDCIYRVVSKLVSFKINYKILSFVQPGQYGKKNRICRICDGNSLKNNIVKLLVEGA